ALSDRAEWRIVAGTPQFAHVGLREILVALADRLRHVDETYGRVRTGFGDDCLRNLEEGLRAAGADVVDAARRALRHQPQQDVNAVADMDEVARLHAVGDVGTIGAEQLDLPALPDLLVQLER